MNDNVPSQIDRMDTERLKGYRRLLDFYYGLQWEGRERRGERHLVFNYARVFIEKITSYLMAGISYAVEADGDDEKSAENAGKAVRALYRVYEDNYLEQLDLETEIDGAVLGDACYKVFWDQNEKRVRVTAPDVQGIYAWWRGDDISRLWRVASRYTLEAEERGQAVLRDAGMGAEDGHIIVPTNCGQQLTDVIEVTDSRAGLAEAKKRITGITTDYRPQQGEYRQRLRLGAV